MECGKAFFRADCPKHGYLVGQGPHTFGLGGGGWAGCICCAMQVQDLAAPPGRYGTLGTWGSYKWGKVTAPIPWDGRVFGPSPSPLGVHTLAAPILLRPRRRRARNRDRVPRRVLAGTVKPCLLRILVVSPNNAPSTGHCALSPLPGRGPRVQRPHRFFACAADAGGDEGAGCWPA